MYRHRSYSVSWWERNRVTIINAHIFIKVNEMEVLVVVAVAVVYNFFFFFFWVFYFKCEYNCNLFIIRNGLQFKKKSYPLDTQPLDIISGYDILFIVLWETKKGLSHEFLLTGTVMKWMFVSRIQTMIIFFLFLMWFTLG